MNLGRDRPWVRTDEEGRYVLDRVAPGPVRVEIRALGLGLVGVISDLGTVVEGGVLEAAETQLAPGGYIVGRIVPPAGRGRDQRWITMVQPYSQSANSTDPTAVTNVEEDLTFRVGPLAPGRYRLCAQLRRLDDARHNVALQRWQGEVRDLRVEAGKDTRDVVITLTEAPER